MTTVESLQARISREIARIADLERTLNELLASIPTKPGCWVDVRNVVLKLGQVYVVRRVFADLTVGDPGLSRWTLSGWYDEYADPLWVNGKGVEVFVEDRQ